MSLLSHKSPMNPNQILYNPERSLESIIRSWTQNQDIFIGFQIAYDI